MLKRLFRALTTRHAGQPDQATIDAVRQVLEQRVAAEEAAIPHTELSACHIRNLRVAIDRRALMTWMPKNSVAAEIGVGAGDFTVDILESAMPRRLHLIDSWSHDERYVDLRNQVADRFAPQVAGGQIVIHQGYSLTELATFADAYFDWVYLDTGHDFAVTFQELELCRAKVKPLGMIAGHDYVTGHWPGWYRYGVIEAVNAFCVKYSWEMVYLTHEAHRHLSYALRPIPDDTQ